MQSDKGLLRGLGSMLCLIVLGMPGAQAEETPNLRYNQATQLKLRVTPAADAAALAQLPINQAMRIVGQRGERWCEVQLTDAGPKGFVDCAFLGDRKVDAKAIETEAARLWLELHQPKLSRQNEAQLLDKLFTQIERAFALSPSLYAYGDYKSLYNQLSTVIAQSDPKNTEEIKPLQALRAARATSLETMRQSLSRKTWEPAFAPVRQSVMTTLSQVLSQRRYGDITLPNGKRQRYTDLPGGTLIEPAPKASFFSNGKWAMGWAGGPMISRLRGIDPVTYGVTFDAATPWVLADVYEMAKAHHVPISANSAVAKGDSPVEGERNLDTLTLETAFPVWAITRDGLVQGHLRSASFGGDACTESPVPTGAKVVFDRPVKDKIYGVFASSVPFDPQKAKVKIRSQTFMEGLRNDFETTFTRRIEAQVDIDDDGVDDLRIVLSTDTEVGDFRAGSPRLAAADPDNFRRVAGWYAYDTYSLQVNEAGWWRLASLYSLVTCT